MNKLVNEVADRDAVPLPEQAIGFWGVEPRTGEDGTPDINFRVFKNNAPKEQRDLKNSVERTLRIVKSVYRRPSDEKNLSESVSKLVALSQAGLVGPNASPSVALDALRALEADILEREAGPIKNHYMRRLGAWSMLFSLVSLLAFLLYDQVPSMPIQQIHKYKTFFLVWIGCMMGAWASFAARRVTLAFGDLVALEEDRIEPPLRLIFAGVLTMILALIFTTGVADIKLGSFQANQILNSGSVAVLVGAFAGLAEKALPSAVMTKANAFVAGLKMIDE